MKKVVNSVLASALALTVAPAVVGAEEATTTTDAAATQETTTTTEETAAPAAAETVDPALQQVVGRLQALGLVAGYEDGQIGADRTITRAEFATLVARARGLEEAAKLAQYQNNFADVHTTDWFAGFVNVASNQEIVKGYADKTFKPQAQVTYAEAITMIVRALGYEPAVKGVWPNNFISKASELGITKTIVDPNKAATRGDIFTFLDNALTVDLMKQVSYGTELRFEEQKGQTLLSEYLDVTVRDMEWTGDNNLSNDSLPFVENVPAVGLGDLKGDEVTLRNVVLDNDNDKQTSSKTFKVAAGIDPNQFLGQHVQVWIKDAAQDTVVWMENSEDETVINDRLDTIQFDGKNVDAGDDIDIEESNDNDELEKLEDVEINLDSLGRGYKLDEDVQITYNFKRYEDGKDAVKGLKELVDDFADSYPFAVKIVLNGEGKIGYLSVVDDVQPDIDTDSKYGSEVIEKVSNNKIKNLEDGSFDLDDKVEGEDFLVFLNGKPAKLADLQPMDVYNVYYADGDEDKPLIFATRNVVEGKVDDVVIKSDNRLKIGDKEYRFRGVSYSDNGNKDVEKLNPNNDENDEQTIRDLDGVKVKAYLDASGRIRHIEALDDVKSKRVYAVVTRQATYDAGDDEYKFKVYTEKGKSETISLEKDDIKDVDGKEYDGDVVAALTPDAEQPVVVEVSYDNNNDVDEVQLVDAQFSDVISGEEWDDAADEDRDSVKIDGTTYDVTDDTVVWDLHKGVEVDEDSDLAEIDNPKTTKFSTVAKKDNSDVVVVTNDDDEVEFIFVVGGDGAASDVHYGLVSSFSDAKNSVTLFEDQDQNGEVEEVEYTLDDDVNDAEDVFEQGDFIAFTLDGDELVVDDVVNLVDWTDSDYYDTELADEDDWENVDVNDIKAVRVDEFEDDRISYENEDGDMVRYSLDNDVSYYDADGPDSLSDVDEDDYVLLIQTEDSGDEYQYVVRVVAGDDADEYDIVDDMDQWAASLNDDAGNGDDDDEEPVDGEFVDNVAGKKVDIAGAATIVRVTADLGSDVDASDIDELVVTIDGEEYSFDPADVIEDGEVKIDITLDGGADPSEGTLTVVPVDGDEQEVDFDINE